MRNPLSLRISPVTTARWLAAIGASTACLLATACGPSENNGSARDAKKASASPSGGGSAKDAAGGKGSKATPVEASGPSGGARREASIASRGQGYRDSSGDEDVVVRKGSRDLGLVASCDEGHYAGKHEAQAKCGALVGENESLPQSGSAPAE